MRLIWTALFSALVSALALPPRPARDSTQHQIRHAGAHDHGHQVAEYNAPKATQTALSIRGKSLSTALGGDHGVLVDLLARGEQGIDGDQMPMRTRTSTTRITLIMVTATPMPDLLVDYPPVDLIDRGQEDGEIAALAHLPAGKARTEVNGALELQPLNVRPRGAQADSGDVGPMRTQVSTRTVTLIIATATPVPDQSSSTVLYLPDHTQGKVGDADVVQLLPGRTVTTAANKAPTAQPTGLLVVREQAGDDNMPGHNLQSILLRQATRAIGRQQDISSSTLWFLLASFGVFVTGVAWNIYVHSGMERERRFAHGLALSDGELGKARAAVNDAADDVDLASVANAVERGVPRSLV